MSFISNCTSSKTSSVQVVPSKEPNTSQICIDPIKPGLGITIGNSMRRTLLSQIPGVAIVSAEFSGVSHEFSSIPGVKEDVPDILLNIKNLVLRTSGSSEGYICLSCCNHSGPIMASSIDCGSGLEIVNKDFVLCNVESSASFSIKMKVMSGVGYVPSSRNHGERYELNNVIPLDAIYNPVVSANFSVSSSANVDGCDKLLISLKTNGSISPISAVAKAAKILSEQLACFESMEKSLEVGENSPVADPSDVNDMLSSEVDQVLNLSVRASRCLKSQNITLMSDLVRKTEHELLKAANFGKKSLDEINAELQRIGLHLGMN